MKKVLWHYSEPHSTSQYLWKYWPDEEGAVTFRRPGRYSIVSGGNTGLMKKVLWHEVEKTDGPQTLCGNTGLMKKVLWLFFIHHLPTYSTSGNTGLMKKVLWLVICNYFDIDFKKWKYWPDEEGAVTFYLTRPHLVYILWKYWPDEEGAVTFQNGNMPILQNSGNTGLMKKVLWLDQSYCIYEHF